MRLMHLAFPFVFAALSACASQSNPATLPAATMAAASMPASTIPASAPASMPAVISWQEAKDHVGHTVTVTGPVISTHVTNDGENVSLNVGKDFPNATRFTVYFPKPENAADPDVTYKGKVITVTGEIVLFRNVPEIKAEAKNIVVGP